MVLPQIQHKEEVCHRLSVWVTRLVVSPVGDLPPQGLHRPAEDLRRAVRPTHLSTLLTDRCIQVRHPGAIAILPAVPIIRRVVQVDRRDLALLSGRPEEVRQPVPGRTNSSSSRRSNSRPKRRQGNSNRRHRHGAVIMDRRAHLPAALEVARNRGCGRRRPERRRVPTIGRTCADHHRLCQDRWALEGEKFIIFQWIVWNAPSLC